MPLAVAFDSAGQLYAATSLDAEHNALFRIDPATGESEMLGQLPAGYHTLAISPDDRIFLGHYDEGALYEYISTGEIRPLTTPGMIGPGGLAMVKRPDGGESLFVAGWKTLHEFDAATGEQRNAWRSAWFPDMISPPRTVAPDGENLLVSGWEDQWGGNIVQVWDPEAGKTVAMTEEFVRPASAIRFQGDLVVIEMIPDAGWRTQRTNGDNLAERHTLGGEMLQQPLGLAASDNDLWVADYATGNVFQLVADGAELAEPTVVAANLDHPEGMALAPDGRLLVAETGTGRLLAIDPATGATEVIAEGLGFMRENPTSVGPVKLAPYFIFSGVAVDSAGNVYVAGDATNVIYRIPAAHAAAVPAGALDDATVAKIESMVEEMMAENEIPGYALGIVKDGEIVYTKGFGVERVGEDKPVTVHSVFGTGSTGKTATAIAVMHLVEAGKIDLDAPVTKYVPYFKLADERYKDITVRHLLTHRSGMPADPADWYPLPVEYDDGAVERYVRSMDNLELLFAPDEEWSYSSLGMIVLADIVAKVSGQTFEEYLQANVLDPLGMADTKLIIPEGDQIEAHWQPCAGRRWSGRGQRHLPLSPSVHADGPALLQHHRYGPLCRGAPEPWRVRGHAHPAGKDLRCHVAAHFQDELGIRADHDPDRA